MMDELSRFRFQSCSFLAVHRHLAAFMQSIVVFQNMQDQDFSSNSVKMGIFILITFHRIRFCIVLDSDIISSI